MHILKLKLPRLTGSRKDARDAIEGALARWSESFTGTMVELDASTTVATAQSFCHELLTGLLVENPLRGVRVVHPRPEVANEFQQAAESLGVGFLLQMVPTDLPPGNPQALREASERWIEHSGGFARVVKEAKSFDARGF